VVLPSWRPMVISCRTNGTTVRRPSSSTMISFNKAAPRGKSTAGPHRGEQADILSQMRPFRLDRFPWLTAAVILVNVAAYAYTARQGPLDIDAMVRFGAKVGPLIVDSGPFSRLLPANFLHRDVLHLSVHILVLAIVGGVLENAYRRLDFLALVLLSGLATMTVSLLLPDGTSLASPAIVH